MKNKFKRIFALIMAMSILMISAAVPISVSADGDGTITIQSDESLKGRSFALYEIFAATTTGGSDIAYNWYTDADSNNIYYDFFYGGWTDTSNNDHDPYMGSDTSGSITAVVNKLSDSSFTAADLSSFANQLYTYITTNNKYTSIATAATVSEIQNDVTSYTVSNLNYGYYLIYDTSNITGAMVRSAVLLTSAAKDGTATLKADVPELSKLVYTINDDTANPKNATAASAMIGDTVTFKLTSYVPDTESFVSGYIYTLTDTLPTGLSYASDLNITITGDTSGTLTGENAASQQGTEDYDYSIDGQVLTINFPDATKYSEDTLTITYDTVLNNSAEQINTNNVTLSYSYDSTDYTQTATLESSAIVYCFDLQITKINSSSTQLTSGSVFNLYYSLSDDAYNNSDDQYWSKIQFDKYTKSMTIGGVSTDVTVYRVYYDDGGSPKGTLTYDLEPDSTTGIIYIEGLGATINYSQYTEGYYRLVETTAPDGYQLPAYDFFFSLYAQSADGVSVTTMAVYNQTAGATGSTPSAGITDPLASIVGTSRVFDVDYNNYEWYKFNVVNLQGSVLPTTGGMGTGAFIIGGVVLMALAAGALIFLNKGKGKNA
ncbi:MAG: isopeptide-forming domain-containing fimbrial protein [Oscillospiraceae bacterium]|nr:isopeptide-forming domain-containing fimbrial protein [Oscillospiraceae bacterium]